MTPQAAAVPYRVVDGHVEVLLVTGGRRGAWKVPKGGLEPGDSFEATAAREALEEAGVVGRVEPPLGEFTFEKDGAPHRVRLFPLRVTRLHDRWREERRRLRCWVPIAEVGRFVRRRAVARLVIALSYRLLAERRAVA